MKPDWKNAPEWANYVAMDKVGDWYWYEDEPIPSHDYWLMTTGRIKRIDVDDLPKWNATLERRPTAS